MNDCRPPEGTKPGTLCVLRREEAVVLAIWNGEFWTGPDILGSGGIREWAIAPEYMAGFGWSYAGLAPELPEPETKP